MGIIEYFTVLIPATPALAFWIAVIVFGAVMLRRGGGRAERYLIAGGSIKIISNLLIVPTVFIPFWFVDRGSDLNEALPVVSGVGIFTNVVSAVGIFCLIYAFWEKFKTRNSEVHVQ